MPDTLDPLNPLRKVPSSGQQHQLSYLPLLIS